MKKLKIIITNRKEWVYAQNRSINRIIESLKQKCEVEDLWILSESGKDLSGYKSEPRKFNYRFFEDYKTDNILEILDKEKPDVVLCSNDYEYLGRSFILASKHRKIPTVLLQQFGHADVFTRKDSIVRGRISILLERGWFIFKKYKVLLKTYGKIGVGIKKIIQNFIDDFFTAFSEFEPNGKYGCDLILVNSEQTKDLLEKKVVKSKIIITGDPQMDSVFNDVSKYGKKKKNENSRKKLVFLTTDVIGHGLWTKKMWETTVKQTLTEIHDRLRNKVDLVLKIHPSSERKKDYEKILKELGYDIPIFQTEKLLDILHDADVVISYAETWAMWEALFLKKPIIVINLVNYPIDMMPFVKFRIAYELKDIHKLEDVILEVLQKDQDKKNISNFINRYLYKFDGKAGERSAEAIYQLVSNFKNVLKT